MDGFSLLSMTEVWRGLQDIVTVHNTGYLSLNRYDDLYLVDIYTPHGHPEIFSVLFQTEEQQLQRVPMYAGQHFSE